MQKVIQQTRLFDQKTLNKKKLRKTRPIYMRFYLNNADAFCKQ